MDRKKAKFNIRLAKDSDSSAIWRIFHAVVASGDSYAFDLNITRDEALSYWLDSKHLAYVANRNGRIVGSYILRANQPALGAHVANAAFMVSPAARRLGLGRLMGEHCLNEARRLGFRAMQFNYVISTNEAAVRLWLQLGFSVVGTLPGAFQHPQRGFVDVYVMFRSLDP